METSKGAEGPTRARNTQEVGRGSERSLRGVGGSGKGKSIPPKIVGMPSR